MRVHRRFRRLPGPSLGSVAAIGNFDGIHRGHKALIDAARDQAGELGAPLGIITFEPHPLQILRPDKAPKRLTPPRTKAKILDELGVDCLFALTFNRAMRERSPEAFVQDILVDALGVRHVVVGYDFRFGHRAKGDTALLAELGEHLGFGVTKVEPVSWRGEVCSSSRIRLAVEAGDIALASDLLGHSFVLEGRVIPGDRRGRKLGFPTANIRPPKGTGLWPPAGIYAVRVAIEEGGREILADGAASLGVRPTFDDRQGRLLEIHLLDRTADLYGKRLCCRIVARIRDEEKFADVEALRAQMTKDCDQARAILAKPGHHPHI
ncbi:MAG: bifunctional riboflavin kinase/FAD synthetase [Geminicoccaceae bacterium]